MGRCGNVHVLGSGPRMLGHNAALCDVAAGGREGCFIALSIGFIEHKRTNMVRPSILGYVRFLFCSLSPSTKWNLKYSSWKFRNLPRCFNFFPPRLESVCFPQLCGIRFHIYRLS